ncbi:KipI family sensor histidine kinase inhibitor [Erwinia toletana]|uniref:KipI family sensor histidine kinase inhibitor n=1 Tax=Winslowiella toletana TaxID=92490 RepID=A0ABS4P433_9GAMM|nr:carboxyltransferase domain-containing protein [Winslowiella toletana]MBP2166825.1 KipI family sensor histidine kinase inhibitor [Winslowiella toletana]
MSVNAEEKTDEAEFFAPDYETRKSGVLVKPRITPCGSSGFLFEAEGEMCLPTQEKIWKLTRSLLNQDFVLDAQAGMNNLLIITDGSLNAGDDLPAYLLNQWAELRPGWESHTALEIPVVYGGEYGCDLENLAAVHGMTPRDVATLHSAVEYVVFAPGTIPGFGYLFGLDPRLATPRRDVPVTRKANATLLIGGAQTNISPPKKAGRSENSVTGWHAIGHAPVVPDPFDLQRQPPELVSPGDRIRFLLTDVIA